MQRKSLLAAVALAGTSIAAAVSMQTPVQAQSSNATTFYRATLSPLNASGARGEATLRLNANEKTLTVMLRASGLEPGGDHLAHIHGRSADGQPVDSSCPTTAQDTDGDGFVELLEGAQTYGPILIDFMNVDPNQDGSVNYTKTFKLSGDEAALPLTDRHIVVHGMTVGPVGDGTDGEVDGTAGYKLVLPVLCGEIMQVGNASDAMRFKQAPSKR